MRQRITLVLILRVCYRFPKNTVPHELWVQKRVPDLVVFGSVDETGPERFPIKPGLGELKRHCWANQGCIVYAFSLYRLLRWSLSELLFVSFGAQHTLRHIEGSGHVHPSRGVCESERRSKIRRPNMVLVWVVWHKERASPESVIPVRLYLPQLLF